MASAAAAASAATTVESPSPPPTTTTTNTSTNTNTISTISIKETLEKYLKIFNTHETTEFVKFYAEDINVHFPAFPPINSRTELQAVFSQGLSYFSERIRPTFFIVDGKKSIAMEARMECVALQPVDFKFPFTGKTYKKGEEFTYEIVYVEWILLFFWGGGGGASGVVPSPSLLPFSPSPSPPSVCVCVRYLFP